MPNTQDKEVISIAYRPRQGPTGGPGGVLFVQESLLGTSFADTRLRYRYKTDSDLTSHRRYIKVLKKIVCNIGMGNAHFDTVVWAFNLGRVHRKSHFIAHEPFSAFGLALARCKYLLIYHQQGSLVAEQESFGSQASRKSILNFAEKIALRKAVRVHFPSAGAQKAYLETSTVNTKASVNFGSVLHNTILPDKKPVSNKDWETLHSIQSEGVIFLSVGALSTAKGIDRIPSLLYKFGKYTSRRFTWIVVGSGQLEASLKTKIKEFGLEGNTILITKRLGHPAILKLMEMADCYVMLHRRAVFDFATLEAMRAGCSIILSNTDGNSEFDVDNNVLLVDDSPDEERLRQNLKKLNFQNAGEINKNIFEKYFGSKTFVSSYQKIISHLVES